MADFWEYDEDERKITDENGLMIAQDVNPTDGRRIVLAVRDAPAGAAYTQGYEDGYNDGANDAAGGSVAP